MILSMLIMGDLWKEGCSTGEGVWLITLGWGGEYGVFMTLSSSIFCTGPVGVVGIT